MESPKTNADILIVGQGLAGTLLGWELERAGVSFAIADAGHASAATLAAAGIINPITGRRLVKSWRIDTLRPIARAMYRELEDALSVPLWREMRVRRLFADEREKRVLAEKHARGDLAPFVAAADESGFWIRDAARVDLAALLARARARWVAMGRWCAESVDLARERDRHALVIDCRGAATARDAAFAFVPWEFSKGEMLELAVEGLEPDVVLNRRHWVLPVGEGMAWAGATHEPMALREVLPSDWERSAAGSRRHVAVETSDGARTALEASARGLLARPFRVIGQRAGVRVNLPDKRPIAGRHPREPRLGVLNGLGAKGALWAPFLARQWADHLRSGAAFDPEVSAERFAHRPS